MCHVIEDPWEVYTEWWGTGKCSDCGRVTRVLYEEAGPADWQDTNAAWDFVETLALNDGVPDLKGLMEDPIDTSDLIWFFEPEVESTVRTCEHCLEARRWLEEWCRSWMYGDYRSDVISHWTEDEVSQHLAFGRLVVLARRRWQASHLRVGQWNDPQPVVPVEVVAKLVDDSLAWLRAKTGMEWAAV